MHFKRLLYYKAIENKHHAFYDPNETLSSIFPAENIKIEIDLGEKGKLILDKSNGLDTVIGSKNSNPLVACFYSIYISKNQYNDFVSDIKKINYDLQPNTKLSALGSHVLIITNLNEFIRRFKESVLKNHLHGVSSFIRYVDPKKDYGFIPDRLIGFTKTTNFQYEREYRFAIGSSTLQAESYDLEIGNIEDISAVIRFDQFCKTKFSIQQP